MDSRGLNLAGFDPDAAGVLDGYLAELEACLPAGRLTCGQIRAEIADGLACAVEEHVRQGQSIVEAAQAAVAEFGDPRLLAVTFAGQLGPAAAHRVGAGLLVTGPLVGLLWVAVYATGVDWRSQIAGVLSAMPQLPWILAVTVPAALLAITGGGLPARLLATPDRMVTGAAVVAVIGCVAADLTLLWAALSEGRSPTGSTGVLLVAVAASVVRLSAAGWAGRRIVRLRAAVN